jgi:hypothetical protein
MRSRSSEFLRARFHVPSTFVDDPPFKSRSSHEAAGHGSRRWRDFPPDTTCRESEIVLTHDLSPKRRRSPSLARQRRGPASDPVPRGSEISPSRRPPMGGCPTAAPPRRRKHPLRTRPAQAGRGVAQAPPSARRGLGSSPPPGQRSATRGGCLNSAIRIIKPICPVRLLTTQKILPKFLRYVGKHCWRIAEREIFDLEAGDGRSGVELSRFGPHFPR